MPYVDPRRTFCIHMATGASTSSSRRALIALLGLVLVLFSTPFGLAAHILAHAPAQAHAAGYEAIAIDLYAATTNAYGDWVEKLDRTKKDGAYWVKGGIKEKGGQVKMLVEASWNDGIAFWQYEEDWRKLDITYKTSDKKVATVSSTGIVTATGDGSVTITATATGEGGAKLTSSLSLNVSGQAGAYVKAVYLCSEKGKQYEEERLTYKKADFKLSLYARLELSDGTTVSNAPKAGDYDKKKLAKYTNLTWSVSDAEVASVNASTGAVRAKALGQTKVYATATGGDPDNKLSGKVRSYVWVVIDDGSFSVENLPADDLTVEVVYDKYSDYTVWSKKYSIAQLKKLETARSTYTFTRSSGAYVTASGVGIHLTTLIDQTPIKMNQIVSFKFTANDGANPGKMSYDYLFNECYFWPNYEFGGNRSGATLVFPMLAWVSDWRDSSSGAAESGENYDELGSETRLRLLFGSKTVSDNRTDHSLKYISKMTVRIEGAPNATHGSGEEGGNGDGDGKAGGNTGGKGSGTGGSTHGSKTGGGAAGGKRSVGRGDDGRQQPTRTQAGGAEASANAPQQADAPAKGDGSAQEAGASGQRWKVYQMLNNADDASLAIQELENNPLAPVAVALVLAALLAGGATSGAGFRRQVAR